LYRCDVPDPDLAPARRRLLGAAARLGVVWLSAGVLGPVLAAPPSAAAGATPERFGAETWKQWLQTLRRPGVVVFTTTDCAHCPAAIAEIERQRRSGRAAFELTVVVMDADPDEDLRQIGHYRSADRLAVFDGPLQRLRHSVDPRWIGVTPYVALLAPQQPVRFVMGAPDAAAWQQFLGR
jgi:hypothetical protein